MSLIDTIKRNHALRISLIYLMVASLWILTSDPLLEYFFGNTATLTHMQTLKGGAFVLITAGMLYLLIARLQPAATIKPVGKLTPWAPLLVFGLLALAIGLTGWHTYNTMRASIQADFQHALSNTGDLKKRQIEAWLGERSADAIVATQESFLARELGRWLESTGTEKARLQPVIQKRLDAYISTYHFHSITVFDQQGKVMLTQGADYPGVNLHRNAVLQAMKQDQLQLVDLHTHPVGTEGQPLLGFAAPLKFNGVTTGVLLFSVDPEQFLYPVLQQELSQKQSDETLLLRREGSLVRFLSGQRFSQASPMQLTRPVGDPDLLASAVARGDRGLINHYRDYRSKRVIAYAVEIAGTPWLLVSKIDEDEAYRDVRQLALISALLTTALLILGGSMTWLWWQREGNRNAALQAQAALERHALTQHYDYLSRYANDVIILADEKGHFIEVSERALEMYGYSREDMLGMTVADLRTNTPATYTNIASGTDGAGLFYEAEHRRKDGSVFTAEISARLIDESGHDFLHMVVRDITDRKNTENALRESENRFRHLVDRVPVALGYVNAAGDVTFINQRFQQRFGYQPEEVPDLQTWTRLAYPDEAYRESVVSRWTKNVEHARLHNTDIEPQEVEITCKNGQVRIVVVSGITFGRDVLATLVDVTDSRADEQRIKRLTQLYATLSRINETIVQSSSRDQDDANSEHALFQAVCDIAVQHGGMVMAWIGTLDEASGRIQPIASAGHGTEYLDGIVISSRADLPEGQGPTGIAIRENHMVFVQDFMHSPLTARWHARGERYGWQASAAIPICRNGRPCAVLTLYHDTTEAFDEEASRLLMEVAGDVSLALENLDIRADRKASLKKLEIANLVVENSPTVLWRWKATEGWPTEYVSSNVRQYGYEAKEFLSDRLRFAALIHPDDIGRIAAEVQAYTQRGFEHYHQEYRILTRDGQVRWISDDTTVLRDTDGLVAHYQGVTNDITALRSAQSSLERLGATLEKSLNEIYVFNAETLLFEQVNEGARNNLDYSMEELSRLTPMDIEPDFTRERFEQEIAPLRTGRISTLVFETTHERKDKSRYPVEVHLQLMPGEHPVFVALVMDISERKQAEHALTQSKQHFQAYFETSPIGMAATSVEKGWLEVNEAMTEILGYSETELKQKTWTELTHPDDLQADLDQFSRLLSGEIDDYSIDKRFIHKSGRIVPTHLSVRALRKPDGQADYCVALLEDITERMQAQQKIEYLAHFDPLTSLPNRTLLTDRVTNMLQLASRSKSGLALLYLDLDRFKNVNDSLGHAAGDLLLQQVAHRLKNTLRDEDTVSRMGGDEFVALLPGTDDDGAARVARKILDALAQPYQLDQYQLNMTASIGIAMYPENGVDFASLSRAADSALYRAKQSGRNDYQFFTDEMHQKALRTMQIEIALRRALDHGELVLHYQPQVEALTGRIVGTEALVRWQHPEWGLTSPADFIPIAEEVGLIISIGEWVMTEAIRQNAAWQRQGLDVVPVAVNLSIAQFRQATLVDMVSNVLQQHQLDPSYLELELTESIAMENIEFTIDTVERLHALGPRLSIDDFGTGYSSLSYLKRFQIDKLKIDQSFVRNLAHDANDEAIVIAIINMAKSLGFKVIAEGVETVEQLAFLRARQCDEIQGYLYSKPVPAEVFGNMLAAGGMLHHAN